MAPTMATPFWSLPEMTLRAAAVVPPTVLLPVVATTTPESVVSLMTTPVKGVSQAFGTGDIRADQVTRDQIVAAAHDIDAIHSALPEMRLPLIVVWDALPRAPAS